MNWIYQSYCLICLLKYQIISNISNTPNISNITGKHLIRYQKVNNLPRPHILPFWHNHKSIWFTPPNFCVPLVSTHIHDNHFYIKGFPMKQMSIVWSRTWLSVRIWFLQRHSIIEVTLHLKCFFILLTISFTSNISTFRKEIV